MIWFSYHSEVFQLIIINLPSFWHLFQRGIYPPLLRKVLLGYNSGVFYKANWHRNDPAL